MKKYDMKSKAISGVMWMMGEKISAQLVTTVVTIVLARILEPRDYGVIAISSIFIAIANVFVTDGFGKALIQKKDADDKDFSSVLYFNIMLSAIIYIIIFMCSPYINRIYDNDQLSSVIRVIALRIPIAAVNSVQQAYIVRNMLFKRFFFATIIGTITSGIIGILMALNGYGVWSLVAQILTNASLDTLILWFSNDWRPGPYFDLKRIRVLIDFGWKILLTSLMNVAYDNVRSLIIGKKYKSEDLAYYTKGIQYPNLLLTNINNSIGTVLLPALSKLQDDENEFLRGLRQSIRLSTFICFPLMMGFYAVADDFIILLLTEKWTGSIPFLRIACCYYMLYPINTNLLQAIIAKGRSGLFLKVNFVKKAVGLVIILVFLNFGIIALAGSEILAVSISVLLNIYIINKVIDYSLITLYHDVKRSLFASVIMMLCVLGLKSLYFFSVNIFIRLMSEISVGVIVYIAVSFVFGSQELRYLLSYVKRRG